LARGWSNEGNRRYDESMKSEPREMIEGQEAWERFQGAMRAAISVPKSAILKDEKRRARVKKKKAKGPKD
jgi:hypothetical protein